MTFRPGQSGNPAGRPRGFASVAKLIMAETRDGAELVEFALNVFRDPQRTFNERMAAHAWLSDRALGKPLAQSEVVQLARIEHAITLPPGWDALPLAQRREFLDGLEAKRIRGTARVIDVLPPGDDE